MRCHLGGHRNGCGLPKPAVFAWVILSLWNIVGGWHARAQDLFPAVPSLFADENQPSPVRFTSFLGDQPAVPDSVLPPLLRWPLEASPPPPEAEPPQSLVQQPIAAPSGYSGPSGVLPGEWQETSDFVPIEDRWRLGFPAWDRFDLGHPPQDDYPYVEGHWWDPYNLNVLKGDYPIIGQHTFLEITASSETLMEARQVPTPATSFESTGNPFQTNFIGNGNQFFYTQFFRLGFDFSHGDAAFKPSDWRVHLQPVFDINYLSVSELGIVSPDVNDGMSRGRDYLALQEWFFETKLADTSPYYDILSARVGSQPFVSDFRGFIFDDTNRAVRLFGTRLANQDQFNILFFDQLEKDTDSGLNTFNDRGQYVLIANYYRQDFFFPGYTAEASFHYDHDNASLHYNDNGFLVRPDPVGIAMPHQIDAYYVGFAGDGHIGRINVSDALYYVFGHDDANPLAERPVQISAGMAALELSYDRDWVRFRTSFLYASGDHNINGNTATGFDSILDDPNFAGGKFSYWQRQQIPLLGVNLVNQFSLLPDLRASKDEGQVNFVNPGLELINVGMDFTLTPKLRLITNVNFLWFDSTNVLEQFVFQDKIHRTIGTDLSLGAEYRPALNNNIIIDCGISGLIPGQGFRDLYDNIDGGVSTQLASFLDLTLTY
jgi:hypothetical protein